MKVGKGLSRVFTALAIVGSSAACSDHGNLAMVSQVGAIALNPAGYAIDTATNGAFEKKEQLNDLHPTLEKLAGIMPRESDISQGPALLGLFIPIAGGAIADEADDRDSILNLTKGMSERYSGIKGFGYVEVSDQDRTY